jgi:hypothetical protein
LSEKAPQEAIAARTTTRFHDFGNNFTISVTFMMCLCHGVRCELLAAI